MLGLLFCTQVVDPTFYGSRTPKQKNLNWRTPKDFYIGIFSCIPYTSKLKLNLYVVLI